MTPWWSTVSGSELAQGDLLPDCVMPIFADPQMGGITDVECLQGSLIIASQTCDLVNDKLQFVAYCAIFTLDEFEKDHPEYKSKGRWEEVRKGREPSLFLLASHEVPGDNRKAFVVDFGHLVSLPIEYLQLHAGQFDGRQRLVSPFLEHFSQGLARFFMRVGLPSSLPPFK